MRAYTTFTPGGFSTVYVPGESYPPVQVPENTGKHPAETGESVPDWDSRGIPAVLLVLAANLIFDGLAMAFLRWLT